MGGKGHRHHNLEQGFVDQSLDRCLNEELLGEECHAIGEFIH